MELPSVHRPARKLEPEAEWPRICLCLITHLRVNNWEDAGSRPGAGNSFALPRWVNSRDPQVREGKEGWEHRCMCCTNSFRAHDKHNYKARVGKADKSKYYCIRQRVGTLLAKQTRKKEELTMNVKIPITVLEEFLRQNQALLPTSWSGGTSVSDPSVEVLFRLVTKTACIMYIQQWTLAPCQQRKVGERN